MNAFETPAVVVDWPAAIRNIAEASQACAVRGVALRPHVKTHKNGRLAREQVRHGAVGVTVAKVAEAEYFVDEGMADVFVAYPTIGAQKARRLADLANRARLIAGVESLTGIAGLDAAAGRSGTTLDVRIEIETGLNRTGVAPAEAVALADAIGQSEHLHLEGVFTFRSTDFLSAAGRSADELGHEEGEMIVAAAELLRDRGHAVTSVSAGSTPTYVSAAGVEGVTEVRPGTYVFHDAMTLDEGTCSVEDIALRVVASVVSTPRAGVAVIDAGSKTLGGDVGQTRLGSTGYGIVGDGLGTVVSLNEEHGIVSLNPGCSVYVGDVLTIVPMHVCTVVNLCDVVELGHGERLTIGARGLRT